MRGDQLIRQWKIVKYLSSSQKGKTVAEIISKLCIECTQRTIYRDLEVLQAAHFPIYNYMAESSVNEKNWVRKWSIDKDNLWGG